MSDIDDMNTLITQKALAVPHASGVAGVYSPTKTGFTIQVTQGHWVLYGPTGYATQRGYGSSLLQDAMRRARMID